MLVRQGVACVGVGTAGGNVFGLWQGTLGCWHATVDARLTVVMPRDGVMGGFYAAGRLDIVFSTTRGGVKDRWHAIGYVR